MHSTATEDRAPDLEPAVAAAASLARSPAAAVRSLQHRAGNRAVARFVGPLVHEARFRALIGTEAAAKGQFLFNGKAAELLYPRLDAALANEPALSEIVAEWGAAAFPAKGRPDYAKADAARAELKSTKFPAELLGPDDARLEVGARVFETLWKTYVAGGGSGGKRSAGTAIKPTQLIGGVKTDESVLGGDLSRGTVATYSAELGTEVERMKRAIDDGWVIHARVLSGIVGGGKSKAEAEHSLIVYGYSGNAFEYFDPDVGGSNVARKGFDRVHYDAKAQRLSTAESEADFAVYAHHTNEPGHIKGYQASGVHRYQVTSIETL